MKLLTFLSLCAASVLMFAQTVPPLPAAKPSSGGAVQEPAVELSPFVISESANTGWIATETLAGTRLRTNFKDVPNQIETLTKDFMDDLGLTSVDQAMIYTANVENSTHDYVTSTPADAIGLPVNAGRMRGIAGGTMSRNFFQVSHATDNFNLERATVASGPNAILFGLGSPAGIVDATPARALMRPKYGFQLQYDSENTKRASFDANVVVVPNKLAARFMGLSKRGYTDKRPNLDRDERLYGALTFTPLRNTSIILQGEKSNRNLNEPGRLNHFDNVSLWYRAHEIPRSGYSAAKPIYNNSSLAGIGSNIIFAQQGPAPVIIQGGSVPTRSWANSVVVRNPSTLPGTNQQFDNVGHTLLDESSFPFDVNLTGTGSTLLLGAYTKTAIIEQKLARNLFLELAYNDEHSYKNHYSAGGGRRAGDALHVDANQFIPGTTTPNPNLGKLYVQNRTISDLRMDERDEWRATLSYEINLAQKLSSRGGLLRWLGRHRVFGLYTESNWRWKNQITFERRILDNPVIPGVTLTPRTTRNWAINASRLPQIRHYFESPNDPTRAEGPLRDNWVLNDANGNPYTLYLFDTPLTAADGKRLGAQTQAAGANTPNAAHLFAWQGFFLPDQEAQERLILSFGYRKDRARSATLDAASTTQDFSGLFPVIWDATYGAYGTAQTGINRNFGAVLRPLKWLTAFYNHSTTFDVNIGRRDPFGNEYPGAGGKGTDYGLRFDLWGDKLVLRINKYENSAIPVRASNAIQDPIRDQIFAIEDRVRELDPNAPTINVVDGNRLGFRVGGRPAYWLMSDTVSEGYEVELNARPVPNWNIRVNGAKSKAVESNIGAPWFVWLALRIPVWQSVVAKNGEVDAQGRPVTWATAPLSVTNPTGQTLKEQYEGVLSGTIARIQSLDGRATDAARPARINVVTNYRFGEGRLAGFSIGGAMRWRAAPTIGYAATTDASGATVLDLERRYRGKRETYFDGIVGYRGKMKPFGGFNYRLQLNVRNLLNEDDPIPVTAQTTGAVARIATIEPRVFLMTFAVDF